MTWKPYRDTGYTVSDDGRVRSPLIGDMKVTLKTIGYMQVGVKGKSVLVHRMVLESHDPVEGMELLHVNHKNGVTWDNRLPNLEWCTPKENTNHAITTGLVNNFGQDNPNSSLKEKEVLEILEWIKTGIPYWIIGDMYQVSNTCIGDINIGRAWKWLKDEYEKSN